MIHGYNLPPSLQTIEETHTPVIPEEGGTLQGLMDAYEREIIIDALKKHRGNISAVARQLKATERVIGYAVKRLGIKPANYR